MKMKHFVMPGAAALMGGLSAYLVWIGVRFWPVYVAFLAGYLTCLLLQYLDQKEKTEKMGKVLSQAQRDFELSQKLEETAQWLERMEMEEEGEEHRKEAFSLLERGGNAIIEVLGGKKRS